MGVARRSGSGPYARTLAATLRAAAEPGTAIDPYGLGPGKAIADQYRYLELLDTAEVLQNGLKAEHEGYDAFLIGNVFEPGLHAPREVLNIPMFGLLESSVHLASLMGASKRMMYAPPTGSLLADIRAAYGDHVYPGAS